MPETTTELPPVTYAVSECESVTLSLTGYENRMAEWAAEHHDDFLREGVPIPGPSKIRRIAYRMCQEKARMWDEDLWNVFLDARRDPTPAQAIKNIERKGAQQP